MNIQIPYKFQSLFQNQLSDYRLVVYYGGRGGGKSVTLSYFFLLRALQKRIKIAIVREVDKIKTNSTYATFKRTIHDLELNQYVLQYSRESITLINGSEILFMGISKHTVDNIRSIDNVSYFWFDEAHNITEEVLHTILPSIRGEDSQVIISLNPQKSDDYIYREFILKTSKDKYHTAIRVNYNDNPFFPKVLERDRLRDYEKMPRPIYLHIWEGETNDYNDMQVIDISRLGYYENNAEYSYVVMSIDTATSTKTGADYSVVGVYGKVKNSKDTHIIHLARGRWDWHSLNTKIQEIYNLTHTLIHKHANVILVEAKANGLNVIQELQRLTHLQVRGVTPTTDKVTRVVNNLLPFLDNLKLPIDSNNPYNFWISDFLRELKQFRADGKHEHDDMVDATSQALNFLYNNAFDFNKIKEALSV